MRTTVRIDDDLMQDLKRQAQAESLSFTKLVNRLLRVGLRASSEPTSKRRFRQKTFRMGQPSANLTKALILAADLEDKEILRTSAR